MTAPGVRPAGTVPAGGAWLRILLAVAITGLCLLIRIPDVAPGIEWTQAAAMVAIGLWAVFRPGSPAVLLLVLGAFAVRLWFGDPVVDAQLYGLVVLVPLVHQAAALAAAVPPLSRLSMVAVLPTAWRYAAGSGLALIALAVAQAAGW